MITKPDDIGSIARRGIGLVHNDGLRTALDEVYRSPLGIRAVDIAHHVFERFTAERLPTQKLRRFVSGWGSTHGTALYVSGLVIRLQRTAREASDASCALLYRAAAEISEVICEDTGVDDVPHQERFDRFANFVVGDDQWKLHRYDVPACVRFREYVKERRLTADLEDAILTTAASENWNTGEYTYLSSLIERWAIDVLGDPHAFREERFAYITVHAGETELGHFLHALKAWELYCGAVGLTADPGKAAHCLESYLKALILAFEGLEQVLVE
jgi:hypothetical protein